MPTRCLVTASLLLTAACAEPGGPGGREGNLLLTLESPSRSAAGADTARAGDDVLVIQQVQLVLREIELERTDGDDDCRGDDDDCEEIELGPMLVDLPLGPGPDRSIRVSIPAGRYDEIEFEIHKPDDDSADDRAFLAQHPDFRKVSIRVGGTFNGTAFTWVTDLGAEQEIDLSPPLVVEEDGEVELTLAVDIRTWFRSAAGLIDPATAGAGGPNQERVQDNIRRSFRAFERDD